MSKFIGFRLRTDTGDMAIEQATPIPSAHSDHEAQSRLLEKINSLGEAFFRMSRNEYGQWLNALPQAEFIEYIALATTDP